MRRPTRNKLIVGACGAVVLCGVVAAWRLTARGPVDAPSGAPSSTPLLAATRYQVEPGRWVVLPDPLRPGEAAPAVGKAPRASTPEEQAAAMNRVSVGSLVRALSQAAAMGNTQAVDDLVKGLPRYGDVARQVIEDELARTKSPKSRDALTRALAELRS